MVWALGALSLVVFSLAVVMFRWGRADQKVEDAQNKDERLEDARKAKAGYRGAWRKHFGGFM